MKWIYTHISLSTVLNNRRQSILTHTHIESHQILRTLFIRMFHEKVLVEKEEKNKHVLIRTYKHAIFIDGRSKLEDATWAVSMSFFFLPYSTTRKMNHYQLVKRKKTQTMSTTLSSCIFLHLPWLTFLKYKKKINK